MLLGKINEWNITLGDKLQEETMTLAVTILKQPFWFHLNIILPRLWKLKHRRECTQLQSIIIILRYLHSCGKKTKLRQGCTPWYNMFDIHGFHPNSTKFSKKSFNVFFPRSSFSFFDTWKTWAEGNLGTTTSQQSEERLLDTVL